MDMRVDQQLHELARRQLGLVHRRQALALGVTDSMLRHRRNRGDWDLLPGGVLRRTGAPVTDRQAVMAAVLAAGPGAVVAGGSGSALWDLPGFRLLPASVMIVGREGRTARTGARVHRTSWLPPHHVTQVDGIPVLTPTRLLFHLAASCSMARMEFLTDNAWSRRLVSGRSLHEAFDELSRPGRRGMGVMRKVLATRPAGHVPPESNLEARVERLLRTHGLPEMRRQIELGGREWLGRVDFVAIDVPLVVFVDGERWHSSVLDRAADARQQAELESAGFTVVRVQEHDVWNDPMAVVLAVRAGASKAKATRRGAGAA